MTNYEHYKEQIERVTRMGGKVAVNKDTGEAAPCSITDCTRCLFFGDNGKKCSIVALEWADEEYRECVEAMPEDLKLEKAKNESARVWDKTYDDMCKQYRDEIDALKDKNHTLYCGILNFIEDYRKATEEIDKLKQEIETRCSVHNNRMNEAAKEIEQRDDEITKLKTENTALRTDRDYWLGKSQALSEKLIGKE